MDTNALWSSACTLLRNEMTEVTYNTWIASALKPLDISGDRFVIEAATDYYHQFVSSRYTPLISSAISKAMARTKQISILTHKLAEE